MDSNNFFDNLNPVDSEIAGRQQRDLEAKRQHIDYLIHQVFHQNEKGAELLEIWKESLVMSPVVQEGCGIETAGIREGMNRMIRNIIITVKNVNEGLK